ncbi:MAG: hypothetical protein B6245_00380 [Desulfobacteraceae bacterium 4572_88]|nr:MAG: hypothetical protein B6245_00380 [Desulfobacteraceae bacterium 4572_88]
MSVQEAEFSMADVIATLLNFIAYLISPILFIWAVNTLFNCEIIISFKTWLAGLILIMLFKFHLKGLRETSYEENWDEYDEDDEYEYDKDDYETESERKARLKAKLIACQNHKNRRKSSPPDES